MVVRCYTRPLLGVGFFESRYWDIFCSARCLFEINTCERKRHGAGLSRQQSCIVTQASQNLCLSAWSSGVRDCLSVPHWAEWLGLYTSPCLVTRYGLQLRWTLKEVTFGGCLLTVLTAGQQFLPWRESLVVHLCVFYSQRVCMWAVLPQRKGFKYLEVFWFLQRWGERVLTSI